VAKKQAKSASVTVIAPVAEPTVDISPLEQSVNAFEYAAWHSVRRSPAGARLSGCDADQCAGGHRSLDPARPASEWYAESLSDVARLLHRDDLANLQYGLKKLLPWVFIEKASNGASRRNTTYVPTESGRAIVDAYLQHRATPWFAWSAACPERSRRCNRRRRFCMS